MNSVSVELKWIWRSSWQNIILRLISLFHFCMYMGLLYTIPHIYRIIFKFYAKKYVQNFAINLDLVLHLSMSGRSNWIDALLHFCFVGHWAWQLFKNAIRPFALKFLLQCHKLAVGTASNKNISKSYIWNNLQKNTLNR